MRKEGRKEGRKEEQEQTASPTVTFCLLPLLTRSFFLARTRSIARKSQHVRLGISRTRRKYGAVNNDNADVIDRVRACPPSNPFLPTNPYVYLDLGNKILTACCDSSKAGEKEEPRAGLSGRPRQCLYCALHALVLLRLYNVLRTSLPLSQPPRLKCTFSANKMTGQEDYS